MTSGKSIYNVKSFVKGQKLENLIKQLSERDGDIEVLRFTTDENTDRKTKSILLNDNDRIPLKR